jgi:hypothetical protein
VRLRLVEQFPVGSPVEISFDDRCGVPSWVPGVVVRHDHPEWFVTSGKRIRVRTA